MTSMAYRIGSALIFGALAFGPTRAFAQHEHKPMSDKQLLALLKKAAPPSVFNGATVLAMNPDGSTRVIRPGTNGWTCMDPSGTDPMCADQGGMEWGDAYMKKGPAPQKLGFIYMLNGDNGASNTDPYAEGPTKDNYWIKTGSHVMIVGAEAKGMVANYPRSPKADPTKPYVMWVGTPYEHLMMPVK